MSVRTGSVLVEELELASVEEVHGSQEDTSLRREGPASMLEYLLTADTKIDLKAK